MSALSDPSAEGDYPDRTIKSNGHDSSTSRASPPKPVARH